MSEFRITINSNWDSILNELDRLDGLPDHGATEALNAVLLDLLAESKARTHVITGSLKNSGRAETKQDSHEWEGKIIFGGPSPGFPNDPVRYAGYERARGGEHDFLKDAFLFHDRFSEAVRSSLQGEFE